MIQVPGSVGYTVACCCTSVDLFAESLVGDWLVLQALAKLAATNKV
jgi:hypothetical protein